MAKAKVDQEEEQKHEEEHKKEEPGRGGAYVNVASKQNIFQLHATIPAYGVKAKSHLCSSLLAYLITRS